MPDDLWMDEPGQTPLAEEEKRELRPSLSTRAQLNAVERLNILAARRWAMRAPVLRRADLLTDAFARELHRRMFNRVWKWAGRYRTSDRNLGWEWARITVCAIPLGPTCGSELARDGFVSRASTLPHPTQPSRGKPRI